MIVKRCYDPRLAQASYLIGCAGSGTAIVIDPDRDVEQYVRLADAEGLRITHVTETHIHADFVSGARELARRTGATLFLSGEGGTESRYTYATQDGATLLHDGDTLTVGKVRIGAVHTPGHTPEHLSFLVTDTATADAPIAMVTGDFVFVGDVGRPDLLERAVKVEGTMERSARTLYASLQAFKQHPDWLQIWPGHGAGSACGKGLSAVPHSTVGYERRFNWAFNVSSEAEFVRSILDGQPEPPRYFAAMKRINAEGPRPLRGLRRPERLSASALRAILEGGATVVDTRDAVACAAGHIPGTVNIPLGRNFITWAGSCLPFESDFYLIIDDGSPNRVDDAVSALAMIGLDRIAGYLGTTVLDEWAARGGALEATSQLSSSEVADRMTSGQIRVLDVRGQVEWDHGHLPGATRIPLEELSDRLAEVPRDRPIAVYCQSGARSAIAASLLQAAGVAQVGNLTGGFSAWRAGGNPVQSVHAPAER